MGKVLSEFGNLISTIGTEYQVATLPTASSENVGKIVQYVGTNTGGYVNGYFYECVTDGVTYSWEPKNVQEASDVAIQYVISLPVTDIEDCIYGIITYTNHSDEIGEEFLDANELFDKTTSGDDYSYTAVNGAEIEASEDDISYAEFTSLSYDSTSGNWTLVLESSTSITLNDGDTFYYRQKNRNYYAGNAEEQSVTPLASGGSGGGSHYLPGEGIDITNSIISIIPSSVDSLGGVKPDGVTTIVSANGTISGNYHGGYGIKVDGNEISTKTFTGTQAEWGALTPSQQAEFDTVNITDDSSTVNNTAGHTVMSDSGSGFPQRTNLQFEGATVTDDSTNDKTKVTVTPYTAGDKIDITNHEISVDESVKTTFIGTKAEWEVLSSADKAKYDLVNLTDDQSGVTTVVDTIADGNMNPVTSNAVYNALSTNNIGTYVDISDYNSSSNMYTLPSDGYVVLVSGAGVTSGVASAVVLGANSVGFATYVLNIVQEYQAYPVYMKKGMKAYYKNTVSGVYLRLYPLI